MHGLFAVCIVATIVAIVLAATPARASEHGTLTLELAYTAQGETIYFSGVNAMAYQVAEVDEDANRYVLTAPFASLDADFNKPMNASQTEELGYAAEELIGDATGVPSTTSDARGVLTFGTIPDGVYLITMEPTTLADGETYVFDAFLVYVPMPGSDGGTTYNVTCLPKMIHEDDHGSEGGDDPSERVEPGPGPDNPDEPDNPGDTDKPDEPDNPDGPGEPDKPGDSDTPPGGNVPGNPNGSTSSRASTPSSAATRYETEDGGTTGGGTTRTTSSTPLSRTGDMTDLRIWAICLAVGGAFVLVGRAVRRRG